jgi:formylglycine-generating enzyme required for sulfatase activity
VVRRLPWARGHDYPYGSGFDASACNIGGADVPAAERGTTPVASVASCQGGYPGLYDMVGNVSEWLDACQGDYCHFYGGAFLDNEPLADFGSCKRFCAGNKKPFRSATIGFRCCHDAGR